MAYAFVASAWVSFSDRVVQQSALNPALMTVKGVAFVWVTAFLLYITVKRLVDAVRSTSRDRDQTANLYRTVVETTAEGVCLLDVSGRISFFNARMAVMARYPREELQGKPFRDLIAKADLPHLDETLRAREAGVSATHECRLETMCGSEIWMLLTTTPIFVQNRYSGLLAMMLDVTSRKHLEEELHHAQKLEALGRFAGGIAHDFNNLLAIMNGYGSLLKRNLPAGSADQNAAGEILAACDRGSLLVRQLLAFSRKRIAAPEVVDVSFAIERLGQVLPRIIGEDIAVEVHSDRSENVVQVGAGQIEQILMNLAANARDAMPKGGAFAVTVETVEVAERVARMQGVQPGSYVALRVSDNGIGIDPRVRPRIFEPFFTTKPQGAGTGLGLSTVYGIVRQNGGFICCDSTVGMGTTFTIHLPRLQTSTKAVQASSDDPRVLTGNETVLLVEDEPALRTLTKLILSSHGYQVLDAANGMDALRLLQNSDTQIDLLLTDVIMPGMTGLELADEVVRLRPSTRIAYMSGYAEVPGELREGTRVIEKPITPGALLSHLRTIFDAGGGRVQRFERDGLPATKRAAPSNRFVN